MHEGHLVAADLRVVSPCAGKSSPAGWARSCKWDGGESSAAPVGTSTSATAWPSEVTARLVGGSKVVALAGGRQVIGGVVTYREVGGHQGRVPGGQHAENDGRDGWWSAGVRDCPCGDPDGADSHPPKAICRAARA